MSPQVRISQFVSDLVYGDAVSNDCLMKRRMLQRLGFATEIYAQRFDARYAQQVKPYRQHAPTGQELIVFHYSVWSELAEYLRSLPGPPLLLIYHNVTPPEYFRGLNPQAEEDTRRGREELRSFIPRTALALADSEYSRRELEAAGFPRTGVLPIALDFTPFHGPANAQILRLFRDGYVNLLTVGRVVPNKKHEDIIKVFYHYKRQINPKARLFCVGPNLIAGRYTFWLQRLVARLGLDPDAHFVGHAPFADLLAYYRLAHVYVSMSEHEGFGVPLVESMHMGVPIIAYAAAAVPFTMGDAGILVHKKDYDAIAEMVHLAATDRNLRPRLIAQGQRRAEDFSQEKVQAQWAGYLNQALDSQER